MMISDGHVKTSRKPLTKLYVVAHFKTSKLYNDRHNNVAKIIHQRIKDTLSIKITTKRSRKT